MNDEIIFKTDYVFVNPPIVNEIIARELVSRDCFASTDGRALIADLDKEAAK